MRISIPDLSLVVLIGPSGAGKSTFAARHFRPSEVISSDHCRALVCDDANDQSATVDAFSVLHYITEKRLARGRLVVIDATNTQRESRAPLVALAKKHHCLAVAIVFNLPTDVCHERNRSRPDRAFGRHVVESHKSQLRRSLRNLEREGFRHIFQLESVDEVEAASLERTRMWNDRRSDHGPFDIIGDLHGCADELEELLDNLGYDVLSRQEGTSLESGPRYVHPQGRRAIFLGDLMDRGPRSLDCLRIVANMQRSGQALCVPGNHDIKLLKKLLGKDVQVSHGLADTLAEIEAIPEAARAEFCREAIEFLRGLVSHYVLDDGKLVVARAGMKETMQGRGSRAVRDFALYGATTGETDEFGLPVRLKWGAEYRGQAMVVFGHTPVSAPEWLNRTVNIDTGCVFGGQLTAFRYPEQTFVSVNAKRTYCESKRPFLGEDALLTSQQSHDDALDAEDVLGKRIVSTKLARNVTIREENAAAALEVMSRFAIDPKWLIYLPPTMSPTETSDIPGYLEHPREAFAYYRKQGVERVICEEKHMGSRAVVVVCRDATSARNRFGVLGDETGVVYTRTGRRFFNDLSMEAALLSQVKQAVTDADLWNGLNTNWVCLDCELMPWSAKAQELIQSQYASVGAAGLAALSPALSAFAQASSRLQGSERDLLEKTRHEVYSLNEDVNNYISAYRAYCWNVETVDDLKLAPFHLLASEGVVHSDKNHAWHMEISEKLFQALPGGVIAKTPVKLVDLAVQDSQDEAISWWETLTNSGGEGMVVKPLDFVVTGRDGVVQPAVKCRGRQYLRIIYGPGYTAEVNLQRLRARGLGRKRSLAIREFALGIEGLERFVRGEPLRRVHECVFGVLALESEPVDPRL